MTLRRRLTLAATSCLLLAVVTQGYPSRYTLFAKAAIAIVNEEQAGRGIAGGKDVLPGIVVKVTGKNRKAKAVARCRHT